MVATQDLPIPLLQLLGGVFATVTAARAWRAYQVTSSPSIRRFAAGFVLLAASQVFSLLLLLAVLTAKTVIPREGLDVYDVLFWLYYGSLLLGLASVFSSFGRHPFQWAPAVTGVLLVAGPVLELFTVLVLFFIVLHAGLNHIARKGKGSSRVAIGFFFLFLAHVANIAAYAPLGPPSLLGEACNLVGLAVLFLSVARPGAGSMRDA